MAKEMAVPEQHPSSFCAKFDEFPELRNSKLGDVVELKVRGTVVSLQASDMHSKGSASLEITNGNGSENYDKMSSSDMRKRLPVKDEEEVEMEDSEEEESNED